LNKDSGSSKYGFYGRLTAPFPSQIIVDATELCNLACIHCPHPEFKKSEHYSARYLDPKLNEKLVNEVRDFGHLHTKYIRYTSNGEPLIHPKIFEMMAYAKLHSKVTVTVTTNGRLLKEPQRKKLIDTGVDLVDISLDAHTSETYSKIRVGGDLNQTRGNVLSLIEDIKKTNSSLKVVTSYVEQPQNTHETQDFEKFWNDNGSDYVVIRRLHSAAGGRPEIAEKMLKNVDLTKRTPCVYPWERIVLGPTGKLAFCPADWTHGSSFIDYETTTIKETWQSEFYRNLRQAHLKNEYSCHKFCGQCPDWQATRWPDEGRAYADMVEDFRREGADVTKG
jgi:MoaA/NifB/PqqE/SkfB family radical SAM enzyme